VQLKRNYGDAPTRRSKKFHDMCICSERQVTDRQREMLKQRHALHAGTRRHMIEMISKQ